MIPPVFMADLAIVATAGCMSVLTTCAGDVSGPFPATAVHTADIWSPAGPLQAAGELPFTHAAKT